MTPFSFGPPPRVPIPQIIGDPRPVMLPGITGYGLPHPRQIGLPASVLAHGTAPEPAQTDEPQNLMQSLMQNPQILALLQGQGAPQLQAPGLLMPQIPIAPYTPPQVGPLYGGGFAL